MGGRPRVRRELSFKGRLFLRRSKPGPWLGCTARSNRGRTVGQVTLNYERLQGLWLPGSWETVRGKDLVLFFKTQEHRIFICSYSSAALVEGKWSGKERLRWQALGGDVGKRQLGDLHFVITPKTEMAIFPERS